MLTNNNYKFVFSLPQLIITLFIISDLQNTTQFQMIGRSRAKLVDLVPKLENMT